MAASPKDTIYIDIDDEITSIIEKVQDSPSKIIALVLPKRATVFQSIVNMKLLKRTADNGKKNIVLITSEANLLPLAGAVGLHVAKTLQSKPSIPAAPASPSDIPVSVDASDGEEIADKSLDTSAPIGQLADEAEETIEVDNDDTTENVAKAGAASKIPFNKKLKVPDFNQFRTRLFLGAVVLVLLIVGWIFANVVLPKATITIKTDTTDVPSKLSITSSPAITEANVEERTIPGQLKELKKTDTQKVPATGQKDIGTKAEGSVTFNTTVSCTVAQPSSIPSGTTVSSGGFSFITQEGATFTFTGSSGSPPNLQCNWKTSATDVVADKAGDQYNLNARDYTVSGFSGVTAKGSAMSGGTSKIIKVISQQDIDGVRQKIVDAATTTANQDVAKLLEDEGFYPLKDTFVAKEPLVVPSPAVDTEADEVTVNVTVSFTMAGAQREALTEILEADIKSKIDSSKQNILDNGLDSASIRIDGNKPSGEILFALETTAKAGVEQNESDIKNAIAGKKKSEVKSIIQSRPGVTDVTVEYGPFWVTKAPKNPEKVTLIFEQQNSSNE
jgi:hypothetical protein